MRARRVGFVLTGLTGAVLFVESLAPAAPHGAPPPPAAQGTGHAPGSDHGSGLGVGPVSRAHGADHAHGAHGSGGAAALARPAGVAAVFAAATGLSWLLGAGPARRALRTARRDGARGGVPGSGG